MDYRLLFIAVLFLFPSLHNGDGGRLCAATYEQQSTMPMVAFRSTSVYADQWNRDAQQSILKADGSVNDEAYTGEASGTSAAPRRAPGTPGGTLDPGTQQPLGDAMIPLLVLVLVYTALLKRQRKGKSL